MTEKNETPAKNTTAIIHRPSSPREFFARIYGHLEEQKKNQDQPETVQICESDSSSDVEVESVRSEDVASQPAALPWSLPQVTPMPLCPRPMLLPHHQIAFGAGLAAFCKI